MKIPFFRNPPKETNIDNLTDEERAQVVNEPLHYRINPCDWAAFERMKKLRLIIYLASLGTTCPCCLRTRVWLALFIGNMIGVLFSTQTTLILWSVVVVAAIIVFIMPMQARAIERLSQADKHHHDEQQS